MSKLTIILQGYRDRVDLNRDNYTGGGQDQYLAIEDETVLKLKETIREIAQTIADKYAYQNYDLTLQDKALLCEIGRKEIEKL